MSQPAARDRARRLGFVCYPYHRGGITTWMSELAAEWRRQGGEAWFVAPRPRRPFVSGFDRPTMAELLEAHPAESRPHVITPDVGDEFEFGTFAYRAAVYADAVLGAVPAGVPVIVPDDASAWRAVASISARNPLVGVLHGDHARYDGFVRRYGKWAGAIVCVSERVRQRTLALPGRGAAPVVTVPCGIRLRPMPAQVRAGRPLRLVWIGRMDEYQKRVSDLPKIAVRVAALGVDFTFDLMGDGEAWDLVRDGFASAGLSSRVRMRRWGSADEVFRLFAESDITLLPSNFEGMPITVMEALSMGCGMVGSRVSGIEDYERHHLARDCYWVHGHGDVDEAARLVAGAAQVPPTRRAQQARALAEAEFSIETCSGRYADLLDRLAPSRDMADALSYRRRAVVSFMSYPVAAQRLARLWMTGRLRRPHAAPATASVAAPVTSQ